MIEKMKMVHVVTTAEHKDEMLEGLRSLGLLHLAEQKQASQAASERFTELARVSSKLQDYLPENKDKKKAVASEAPALLSDETFEQLYQEVRNALAKKDQLTQQITADITEMERIEPWGPFSPKDVRELQKLGYDLHFYRVDKDVCAAIMADENLRVLRLASVDKADTIAVIGALPMSYNASEFTLPEKGLAELKQDIADCQQAQAACDTVLRKAALHENSFHQKLLDAQNAEEYSSASETAEGDAQLVWLSGYIPEIYLDRFKEGARENHWAYAIDEVSTEDEHIPTKLRYNKVSKLIKPLYDMLGILPGYYETDISLWFLLFFALFFAMIIGDGGYGLLFLIAAIVMIKKSGKIDTASFLLLVLSTSTVIWGAITGTWFGMESAMKVPFLRALVLPGFANYPEYFDVPAALQQNNMMKFSFTIGAMQMELGSLLAVKKKMEEKDLSFLSDIGWLFTICGMYLLALYLVLHEQLPLTPVVAAVAIGFVLVLFTNGMAPGKSIGAGIASSLGGAFTVFLNTISCFGNIMSYIRLFAVGMAGLAIAQSFNNMAAGLAHGPLMIAAVVIVLIGHVINIVMCILSVVVHGVRLNVLEFSGQVGLEWTGIAYNPFRLNDKIKQ